MKLKFLGLIIIFSLLLSITSCGGGGGNSTPNNPVNPDKTVSVVFKDSSGNPLSNVSVMANGTLIGTTNANGELKLNKEKYQGKIKLQIMSSGIPLYEAEEYIDTQSTNVEIRAKRSSFGSGSGFVPPVWQGEVKLSGIVKDSKDNSITIAGANLLLAGDNGFLFAAYSEKDGKYRFYDIPKGQYKLITFKFGYNVSVLDITITDNETNQDVFLINNGSLPSNGFVLKGVVKSKTGQPLANAAVEIFLQPEPYVFYGGDNSNSSGNTTVKDEYAAPTNGKETTPKPLPKDPRFGPNGGLNNQYWNSNQRNASKNLSGNSSPSFAPEMLPPDEYYRYTTTNENGEYYFDKIFAVSADIYVNCENYRPAREYISFVGKSENIVNFELEPIVYTSLCGKVINSETKAPISNANIHLACIDERFFPMPLYQNAEKATSDTTNPKYSPNSFYAPGGEVRPGILGFYNTTTNNNGEYCFDKIPVGSYFASVYADKFECYGIVIELKETENTSNFELNPMYYCTVTGYVKDAKGNPIKGAFVSWSPEIWYGPEDVIYGATGTRSNSSSRNTSNNSSPGSEPYPGYDDGRGIFYDITDSTGKYTITEVVVGEGKAFILANAERYITNGVEVKTVKNQTITAPDIVLQPLWDTEVTVSGTVTDTTGKPLHNVYVWATYDSSSNDIAIPMVILDDDYTDKNGNYRLRVPKGNITINAAHPGFKTYSQSYFADNNPQSPNILNIILTPENNQTNTPK